MQRKFKIGDKVKVLTKAYSSAYGTAGVITKVGGYSTRTYTVDRNTTDYPPDQYGHFDHDSWRYCFYESELELVEDKPKTKFKAGDKVVCVDATHANGWLEVGKEYTVTDTDRDMVVLDNLATCLEHRFELVTDQEVSKPEPSVQITVNIDENICAAFNEVKNGLEILLSGKPEPNYVIGQEVYVSNDLNRYLRKGILLDAIPRNGLMHINIGGFDCYVEEERVYTREETKGKGGE